MNILLLGRNDGEAKLNLKDAHIVVSTPGSLVEALIRSSDAFNLAYLRFLVIDEADRMQDTARSEWLGIVERRARGM